MQRFFASMLVALSTTAGAQTVIYDTFNEDDQANLFDCCNTLALPGRLAWVAVPFTAPANGRVIEIDLPLSSSGMTTRFDVRLMGSSNGLPGRLKRKLNAEEVPPGGQCCSFVVVDVPQKSARGRIHGGDIYWIEVNANTVPGGWNLNTLGLSGPYATTKGKHGAWQAAQGALPAIRVIGQ